MRFSHLILSILLHINIYSQVDLVSTKNNVLYGVHGGLEITKIGYGNYSSTHVYRLNLLKMVDKVGFYFSYGPTFGMDSRREIIANPYQGNSQYYLGYTGPLVINFKKDAAGLSYSFSNWLTAYGGLSVSSAVGVQQYLYYEKGDNAKQRPFAHEMVIKDRKSKPEFGVNISPLRFLSISVGYDMLFENISYGLYVGWYLKSERSRYRRKR